MRPLMAPCLASLGLVMAGACTPPPPIPVAVAERQCAAQALGGSGGGGGTSGTVGVGLSSYGGRVRPSTGVSLAISSDMSRYRDPNDVFTSCVVRRSGQYPTRPLFERG